MFQWLIGIILGEIIYESSIGNIYKDWRSLFRLERIAKCSYFILSTQNIKFYWFVMKIRNLCCQVDDTIEVDFLLGINIWGLRSAIYYFRPHDEYIVTWKHKYEFLATVHPQLLRLLTRWKQVPRILRLGSMRIVCYTCVAISNRLPQCDAVSLLPNVICYCFSYKSIWQKVKSRRFFLFQFWNISKSLVKLCEKLRIYYFLSCSN